MSDVTLKVSEKTFGDVFNKVYTKLILPPFKGETPGADDSGIVLGESDEGVRTRLHVTMPWLGIEGQIHLVSCKGIEFNDDDTFTINEMDIGWDKLILKVGLDIPTMKFGGECLLSVPDDSPIFAGDCVLYLPELDLFTKTPDIEMSLNLSPIFGVIISEMSAICSLELKAENKSGKDVWAIYAHPVAVDFDLIDIHDTLDQVPGLVYAAVAGVVVSLKTMFPVTWMMDAFLGFLGLPSMTSLALDVLDISDDTQEWLMKALKVSIGIDSLIEQLVLGVILNSEAIFDVPKLYEVRGEVTSSPNDYGGYGPDANAPTPPTINIPAVKIPVTRPEVHFNDDQMILTFDFEF